MNATIVYKIPYGMQYMVCSGSKAVKLCFCYLRPALYVPYMVYSMQHGLRYGIVCSMAYGKQYTECSMVCSICMQWVTSSQTLLLLLETCTYVPYIVYSMQHGLQYGIVCSMAYGMQYTECSIVTMVVPIF